MGNMNFLIAMKNKSNVQEVLNAVAFFDALPIARVAISYGLFEEAFAVYDRSGNAVLAVQVLCRLLGEMGRAREYAKKRKDPATWRALAAEEINNDNLKEAIHAYIQAKDASNYKNVVERAMKEGFNDSLNIKPLK